MGQRKIAPPSISGLLGEIAGFSDSAFERIAAEIQKPASTDLGDERCEILSNEIGVATPDLRMFLSFISFLYDQTEGIEGDEVREMLVSFLRESLDENLESDIPRLAEKISDLLQFRETYDASMKRKRLTRGFLPFVETSASFVDVRPDFVRDDEGKLTGELNDPLIVAQLLIATDSFKDNERQMVFQLDRAAAENLQETLAEILAKIAILEASN